MARTSTRGTPATPRPEVELPEETLFDEADSAAMRRVLLASLETFAELGFHGTATRDIARRAAVSPAGLYVHYSSKHELLEHIIEVTHDAMLQRMRVAAAETGSAQDRLRAVVNAHVRFHAKYNTACRVANYELGSLEADARARMRKLRQAMEKVVSDLIREGVDSGEFVVDDQQIVTTFILSLGIDVARWFRAGHRLSPDQLAELYADLVIKSVAATPPGPKRRTNASTGKSATRPKAGSTRSSTGR
jgi:AcrR family transcriptional regulator